MTRKILILGDSHSRAVRNALDPNNQNSDAAQANQIDVRWVRFGKNGETEPDEALRLARSLGPESLIIISFLGTLHNTMGLMKLERPFDFYEGPNDTVDLENAYLVTYGLIYETFLRKYSENRNIKTFSEGMNCLVYMLMPPPPKGSNEFIASVTKQYRGNVVTEHSLNSARVRLKLWRLEYKVLSEICTVQGINMLPPIRASQTPEGFLRPEFYANDATHSNSAYGMLVRQQLEGIA